jgi:MATE family multidrug resistance protein
LFFISNILVAFNVDEQAAYYAGVYARNMIFGLYMQS